MRIVAATGRALDVGTGTTRIMGVLNVTPDSFSDGGQLADEGRAVDHGLRLVAEGADVLDVGGESTRPGHEPVPAREQLRRVLPVLERLRRAVAVPISIDTTLAQVAREALAAGADWVNDTLALQGDPELGAVVAAARCPIVLMHRFEPARRDGDLPRGRALVARVAERLAERVAAARRAGIDPDLILLDPGVGFGTRPDDSVALHAHVDVLRGLGRPLLVGPSRKSFLGHLTGRQVGDRSFATAAAVATLALAGVEIVRVHDVAAMRDVVRVCDAIRAAGQQPTDGGRE